MKKSQFTEPQIVSILKEQEAAPTKDVCRHHGISETTFYKWKAKFGGMEISDVAKMRALEDENRRLKRIVADQALHVGAARRMIRYVRIPKDDEALRARLQELAAERRRFGFRRLAVLLRRDDIVVNIKRVLRIYREANLEVRKRVRRRVALGRGTPPPIVSALNERWSLDFVHDALRSGRRIRTLNIVDDFSRECLDIEVDTSLSGQRVVRTLDAIAAVRGYPRTIVRDNGPELTSLAMLCWARDRRVQLHFIQPGKPTQNAYIESFHGRFRDECLNEHEFSTFAEARSLIEHWRLDYNALRPHRALQNRTSEEASAL